MSTRLARALRSASTFRRTVGPELLRFAPVPPGWTRKGIVRGLKKGHECAQRANQASREAFYASL